MSIYLYLGILLPLVLIFARLIISGDKNNVYLLSEKEVGDSFKILQPDSEDEEPLLIDETTKLHFLLPQNFRYLINLNPNDTFLCRMKITGEIYLVKNI